MNSKSMKSLTISIFLIALLMFASCSEEENPSKNNEEPQSPVIETLSAVSAYPGQLISIAGKNFGSARNGSFVEFGSIKPAEGDYTSWSDILISVKIPASAASGNVVVNVKGKASNPKYLTINQLPQDKPVIFTVDSTGARIGSTITITGKNFKSNKDTSYVLFNNIKALVYQLWNDSTVRVVVPSGAVSGNLSVFVGGQQSNSVNFNIINDTIPAPYIESIIPATGTTGIPVTIRGRNFGAAQGISFIKFQSVTATSYLNWTDTEVIVVVPNSAATGKVYITVNGKQSNGVDFTVNLPSSDPVITNLDANIAQVGQAVGINGKNFGASRGSSYAEFNGTNATIYNNWTDTKIIVVVPDGATSGNIFIYVNGKRSNGVNFTVQQSNQIVPTVLVKSGNFSMGNDQSSEFDDKPAHNVKITSDFYIAKTEITQKQYKTVMGGSNPSHPNDIGDNKPVQQVTFIKAIEFCNNLSDMEQKTKCYTINGENVTCDWDAAGYRLPTEAEWEYASRAGKTSEYTENEILTLGWTAENCNGHTQDAGIKQANSFGIFDMNGNVFEMCWDWYDFDYYKNSPTDDPKGPVSMVTAERVKRGGSFINGAATCGATKRDSYPSTGGNFNSNLGFRVVRKK